MTNTALNIPEGFESATPTTNLVFQNLSNWAKSEAEGVMVRGIYEGETEPDAFGKKNFQVKATAPGSSFDKEANEKSYPEGATVIVNTCASIANKLRDIEVGTEIIILYQGQNKLTKGPFRGKMSHSIGVLIKK